MRTPIAFPLAHQMVRAVAYQLFQLALVLAYLLRSVGALRLPFHFNHAATDDKKLPGSRRVRPRTSFSARPAL